MSRRDDATLPEALISRPPPPAGPQLALTVVHHASPRALDRAIFPPADAPLLLGRGGALLGPGGLDDPLLSRRHLEITRRGDRLALRDPGSLNGTRLNGQRITRATAAPGDVVGVGGILLLVHRRTPGFSPPESPLLVGRSEGLGQAMAMIARVASRSTPALILGETGTGKELAARELHRLSGRAGPLVAVNCGAMEPGVIASELFGHARGAYSGAAGARGGLIEAARGGTLFLDEIGDAPPRLQVSLLRLLQEGTYRPVGADRERTADARFVAATWRDLDAEVAAGRFRQDLLARLQRWVIRLPPLRARRADILPLALRFAREAAGRPVRFSRDLALALLLNGWPLNARGLHAAAERLVLEADVRPDTPGDVALSRPAWLEPPAPAPAGDATAPEATAPEAPPSAAPSPTPSPPKPRTRRPRRPSPEALRDALIRCDGNMKALAAELGVGRTTLYRWMKAAGLDPEAIRDEIWGE